MKTWEWGQCQVSGGTELGTGLQEKAKWCMGRTQFYRGVLSAFEQVSSPLSPLILTACRDASYCLAFLWGLLRPSYEMTQGKVHWKPKKRLGVGQGVWERWRGTVFFTALNPHQENPSATAAGHHSVTYHPHFMEPTYSALSPVWTKGPAAESQDPALSILKWASSRTLPWDLEARGGRLRSLVKLCCPAPHS